jgi:hypothetical protein
MWTGLIRLGSSCERYNESSSSVRGAGGGFLSKR